MQKIDELLLNRTLKALVESFMGRSEAATRLPLGTGMVIVNVIISEQISKLKHENFYLEATPFSRKEYLIVPPDTKTCTKDRKNQRQIAHGVLEQIAHDLNDEKLTLREYSVPVYRGTIEDDRGRATWCGSKESKDSPPVSSRRLRSRLIRSMSNPKIVNSSDQSLKLNTSLLNHHSDQINTLISI
ncbi:hypothetical protein F511_38172 [Dorcoceras hygrometricum]|uniref:Uncharacterized protein n=1 Tax=Dorcoceras hygrometricum TaxID=472368 RepID=A0A2Z7CAJ1_9LAMI|nr:hypothetical protein F511_38172 [Dorcoceras hygrometricum]